MEQLTTGTRRLRRGWWIVLAALVLMIATVTVIYLLAGRPTGINYYRVTDGRTIQVGVVTGADTWTRMDVDETPSAVTVAVYSFQLPGNRPGIGFLTELAVTLDEPLGNRSVVDGRDGRVVDQTRCSPPDPYLAPGCIVD